MPRSLALSGATLGLIAALSVAATAQTNSVSIRVNGEVRCITSNGTPPHAIGQFPNAGNPHSFQVQTVQLCVDATPELTGRIDANVQQSGITLSGIVLRPDTADWYDASSPRGHSRDPSSGWNLDGMGPENTLGLDANAAHVDHRGLYHYHGVTDALTQVRDGTRIGYAADGFEIHYVGEAAQSSWQLKSGTRPTAPGGAYDGSYNQDWEFVEGSGNLDQCNGGLLDGQYVYFATEEYPFFPRCFRGTVSDDFKGRG